MSKPYDYNYETILNKPVKLSTVKLGDDKVTYSISSCIAKICKAEETPLSAFRKLIQIEQDTVMRLGYDALSLANIITPLAIEIPPAFIYDAVKLGGKNNDVKVKLYYSVERRDDSFISSFDAEWCNLNTVEDYYDKMVEYLKEEYEECIKNNLTLLLREVVIEVTDKQSNEVLRRCTLDLSHCDIVEHL